MPPFDASQPYTTTPQDSSPPSGKGFDPSQPFVAAEPGKTEAGPDGSPQQPKKPPVPGAVWSPEDRRWHVEDPNDKGSFPQLGNYEDGWRLQSRKGYSIFMGPDFDRPTAYKTERGSGWMPDETGQYLQRQKPDGSWEQARVQDFKSIQPVRRTDQQRAQAMDAYNRERAASPKASAYTGHDLNEGTRPFYSGWLSSSASLLRGGAMSADAYQANVLRNGSIPMGEVNAPIPDDVLAQERANPPGPHDVLNAVEPYTGGLDAKAFDLAPMNPTLQQKGRMIVGGVGPMVAGSAIPGGAPTVFGLQGLDTAYRDARASGADDSTAMKAGANNMLAQAGLGTVPGGALSKFVQEGASGLAASAGRVGLNVTGNALVGAAMSGGENANARALYDPNRPLTEGMGENALAMGAFGGVHSAVEEGGRVSGGVRDRRRQRMEQQRQQDAQGQPKPYEPIQGQAPEFDPSKPFTTGSAAPEARAERQAEAPAFDASKPFDTAPPFDPSAPYHAEPKADVAQAEPLPGGDLTKHYEGVVTDALGPGVKITSEGRSAERNAKVGGVSNSYHLSDQAIDFIPPPGMTMAEAFRRLKASGVPFIELLNEGDHIHIAFGTPHGERAPAEAASVPSSAAPVGGEVETPSKPVDLSPEPSKAEEPALDYSKGFTSAPEPDLTDRALDVVRTGKKVPNDQGDSLATFI